MPKSVHFLVSLAVALIGLAICGWAVSNSIDIVDMLVHGEKAEGLITESVKVVVGGGGGRRGGGGRGASIQYNITVRYTDAQGVTHTAKPPVNDDIKRLKGERVSLYYLPDAPDKVMVDVWTSKAAPIVIPLVVGLAFVGGGVFMLREARREDEDDADENEAEKEEDVEPVEESRWERIAHIVNPVGKWVAVAFILYWFTAHFWK